MQKLLAVELREKRRSLPGWNRLDRRGYGAFESGAALATKALGRRAQEVIPLLNDLSENGLAGVTANAPFARSIVNT